MLFRSTKLAWRLASSGPTVPQMSSTDVLNLLAGIAARPGAEELEELCLQLAFKIERADLLNAERLRKTCQAAGALAILLDVLWESPSAAARAFFWLTNVPYWLLAVRLLTLPAPLAGSWNELHAIAALVVAAASTAFHGFVLFGGGASAGASVVSARTFIRGSRGCGKGGSRENKFGCSVS